VAITGVSGSGKSSLAFDIIFQEGLSTKGWKRETFYINKGACTHYWDRATNGAIEQSSKYCGNIYDHLFNATPAICIGRSPELSNL
jgi:hypothetical protein